MKKWFCICTTAIIAGFIAFTITFVKYDLDNNNNKEILPIKISSEKDFVKAQSAIMINPESINDSYENEQNIVINNKDNDVREISVEPIKYFHPVDGNIIRNFAKENLIYSKTLKEWSTHNGIDIAAEIGSDVKCIYNGIVSNITFDYKYGNLIEIDHKDGYKSIYANIEKINALKVGDKINGGDIIGKITDSYGIELEEVPHLHFELLKNNNNINPEEFLKYCERGN